jgi:hypothetical protein
MRQVIYKGLFTSKFLSFESMLVSSGSGEDLRMLDIMVEACVRGRVHITRQEARE